MKSSPNTPTTASVRPPRKQRARPKRPISSPHSALDTHHEKSDHRGLKTKNSKPKTTTSRPRLLFIFAHPDDDAFGPAGTITKLARDYDIYFLCATRGESGKNHSSEKSRELSDIRAEEVIASSRVVGAKGIHFLGFMDGSLCNNIYHDIAAKIMTYVDRYQPSVLMTWEPQGLSGHIDHIVMSMVTHYVFYRSPSARKLMLFCQSESQMRGYFEEYFIYRPPGYAIHEIDEVYDVSDVWETKLAAMKCHPSQIKDMEKITSRPPVMLMEECFLVVEKDT